MVARVAPDKVQLNTPVRPSKDPRARAATPARLEELCDLFTPRAEVIAEHPAHATEARRHEPGGGPAAEELVTVLERRPCTIDDLAVALSASAAEVRGLAEKLLERGAIEWADATRTYLRAAPRP